MPDINEGVTLPPGPRQNELKKKSSLDMQLTEYVPDCDLFNALHAGQAAL